MSLWRKLLGKSDSGPIEYRKDPFITSCLEVSHKEREANRWFSHFEELPQIDNLRRAGKRQEALALCLKGLGRYPDSFLFTIALLTYTMILASQKRQSAS